jgi:mRNA-degrading endonuclease RelE of RelBE toxin-antitoxin system
MPEYRVIVKPSAAKEIDRLPISAAERVIAKIEMLAATPRPPSVKKLEGEPMRWRISCRRLAGDLLDR